MSVVLACAGVAASSAVSSDDGKVPLHRATTPLPAHEVKAPSAAATASAVPGARLRFFETAVMNVTANGRLDGFLKCPRTFKAINGYFATDGSIFPDYSAQMPGGVRRWGFGLQDVSGLPGQAYVGIVCLKGIAS